MKNQYEMDELLDLTNKKQSELFGSDRSEAISVRTFRYWINRGLVPRKGYRGRMATYSQETVDRLLFIRMLQKKEGLSLHMIGQTLEAVEDETIARVVSGEESLDMVADLSQEETDRRLRSGEQLVDFGTKGRYDRRRSRRGRYARSSDRRYGNGRDRDREERSQFIENGSLSARRSPSYLNPETYMNLEKIGETEIAALLRSVEMSHSEYVYESESSMREMGRTLREMERSLREMEDRYREALRNEEFISEAMNRMKDTQARLESDLARLEKTLEQSQEEGPNGRHVNE